MKPSPKMRVVARRKSATLISRVVTAARRTANLITLAHGGDESNIADENALVAAVEALNRHEGKLRHNQK